MKSDISPKILGISPETVARECQAIARRHAEHYGRQRGLHVLGKAIGEGDRRAAIWTARALGKDVSELLARLPERSR